MQILNQIRTLSVIILGLAGAVTASGQVVVFDNMPSNAYNVDAGQCLTVDENQDCDPPERRRIANGFVPSESGTLARINLPIDYCTSYCGTCAGNGYEEEFSIDVSIQADDGGVPGEQSIHKLGAFSKTLSCGSNGVVDIDARGSGVQFVAGERYWLVVEYTHNDSSGNISWDSPNAGTADDDSNLVARYDCGTWDANCLPDPCCLLDTCDCLPDPCKRSAFRIKILLDDDGDGIPNRWETEGLGIDVNNDGTIDLDLYALGARPDVKDVFVEVDWMEDRGPLGIDVIQEVRDAGLETTTCLDEVILRFLHAPVDAGIHLHIEIDEEAPRVVWQGDGWGNGEDEPPANSFNGFKAAHFGTVGQRTADPNGETILKAKRMVYRYCVFADKVGDDGGKRSGSAEVGGNDLMITLGSTNWDNLRDEDKAEYIRLQQGTFMHELGHTLGLRHGGIGDDVNCKPNYYSVMNYTWQLPQSWNVAGSWALDYSRFAMATLVENDLDECTGMGDLADHDELDGFTVPYNMKPHGPDNDRKQAPMDTDQVDWDKKDGMPCPTPGTAHTMDLNRLLDNKNCTSDDQCDPPDWCNAGKCEDTGVGGCDDISEIDDIEVLVGHEDWTVLDYNFRDSADYADGAHDSAEGLDEMTTDVAEALNQILPAPCPADVFGDDPVIAYDGFESGSLVGWNLGDSTGGVGCGEIGIGSWCAGVDTAPLECSFSVRLFAEATSSAAPYAVVAAIKRNIAQATHLSVTMRFDEVQGSGGTGHSFFQIAVIDAENEENSYRYGFSATGNIGGDTKIQVEAGEVLDFTADFAVDFLTKYGYAIPGMAIVRLKSSTDFAENAPVGQRARTTDVTVDNVVVHMVEEVVCPRDLNGDGIVNAADLAQLLGSWGPCDDCEADFNGDGMIDAADLAQLLGSWGPCSD